MFRCPFSMVLLGGLLGTLYTQQQQLVSPDASIVDRNNNCPGIWGTLGLWEAQGGDGLLLGRP
jgi:hypothetical protein